MSFYVNDPKLRHIHKASVRDRLLHHAVFRVLYPLFDQNFIYDSYSCRIEKGTHRAVNRLKSFLLRASRNNTKNIFVLKCDVRKFFDSIDHEVLRTMLRTKITDAITLWLLDTIIDSYSTRSGKGIPLGNVTSQLLANIYLNELDQFAKHQIKAKYYLRYCDDFIVLGHSREELLSMVVKIDEFLKTVLRLKLHPNKISIRTYRQGIDFLGYVVLPYHRVLRTKTKKRIFVKIMRRRADLSAGIISAESFERSLQSYFGVLKHCQGHRIKINIQWQLNQV